MARKKSVPVASESQLQLGEDWWLSYLKSRGYISETRALSPPTQTSSQESLSNDMEIFLTRVAEKVASAPEGITLTPTEQTRLNQARQKIKDGLREVLNGRTPLGEWFTKTRQQHNLKNYELAQIMYESLDGLKSREAKELKEQWFQFLAAEKRGYGLA